MIRPDAAKRPWLLGSIVLARCDVCPPRATFVGFDASKRAEERPMKCLMMTVLLSVLTASAWAQEPGDAPEHGVARISMMSGDVTVRRGDSGEDIAAEVNAPLVALDHVFTNQGSRAELQFDSVNFLRLAPDSEVRLSLAREVVRFY